jgi:hypothetical protein
MHLKAEPAVTADDYRARYEFLDQAGATKKP